MFKTLSRFTSSFAALLGSEQTAGGSVEDIRTAMVYQVSVIGNSVDCTAICTEIAMAGDIQTLWYLRSNLVNVLAERFGEKIAREKVNRITEMFHGLIPKSFLDKSGAGPRNRSR